MSSHANKSAESRKKRTMTRRQNRSNRSAAQVQKRVDDRALRRSLLSPAEQKDRNDKRTAQKLRQKGRAAERKAEALATDIEHLDLKEREGDDLLMLEKKDDHASEGQSKVQASELLPQQITSLAITEAKIDDMIQECLDAILGG